MEKIKIKKKNYNVKYSLRALFLYEQITGKSFEITNTMETFIFYYCMILANNPDTKLTFDDFIDAIDTDPQLAIKMAQIMSAQNEKRKMLGGKEEEVEDEDEKKKIDRRWHLLHTCSNRGNITRLRAWQNGVLWDKLPSQEYLFKG